MDSCIITMISVVSAITARLLIATESPYQEQLGQFLTPLISAMIVSGGAIMLNPKLETRKIIIGRSFFGLLIGAIAPSLLALTHPAMRDLISHVAVQLALGGGFAYLAFIISKPFTDRMFGRSEYIADDLERRLEDRIKEKKKF